jgi:phosphoribosyl 1,2-cyclic phosphate phosphodiesterase
MISEPLKVTLLGTGTSTGVPVPGCDCTVCLSSDPLNSRTRCSLLIGYRGKNILIDTATDLRQQVLREGVNRIDAVLYTHTHADHIHGIDDLRPFNHHDGVPLPLYASADAAKAIRQNFRYIFSPESGSLYRPRLAVWTVAGPFSLFGLPVTPLRLEHGAGQSTGYRIGPIAYLTDCSSIPAETHSELENLDLLIIDALRFRPHSAHLNIAGAIVEAERIGAKQTLLTHLSHDVDHDRHSIGLPVGIGFAFDGQTLQIATG